MSGIIVPPSYQAGFYSKKRGGRAKYPNLWRGLRWACSPCLGQSASDNTSINTPLVDRQLRDQVGNNDVPLSLQLSAGTMGWQPMAGVRCVYFAGVAAASAAFPADLLSLQVNMTMAAWAGDAEEEDGSIIAQYRNVTAHQLVRIFGYSNTAVGYYCSTASGGFQFVNHPSAPPAGAPSGRFNCFIVTLTGTLTSPVITLSLNGVDHSTALAAMSSTPDVSAAVPFTISCNYFGGNITQLRRGAIAELLWWDRPLSQQERNQLYAGGPGMVYTLDRSPQVSVATAIKQLRRRRNQYTGKGGL
jgi:hypothetical protein